MSLPPELAHLAQLHRARQQELARRADRLTRRLWRLIDPRNALASWRSDAGPAAFSVLSLAQTGAATGADDYVSAALAMQDVTGATRVQLSTSSLTGVASDGRPLASLLEQPAWEVDAFVAGGLSPAGAMTIGARHLQRIVATQVADAARVATGVATVASQARGYIRMLSPPSCSRCIILAGRSYGSRTAFQRHPLCDCVHIPAAEHLRSTVTSPRDYFDSLGESDQDRTFTKAGAQAIRDGADPAKVVNARRGGLSAAGTPSGRRQLQRSDVHGQPLFVTTEGRQRRRGAPRLMPESIYEIARNREDAIRLLRLHGYIL